MNKRLQMSFGALRAEHSAMVAQASFLRQAYAVNHQDAFADAGREHYIELDGDGKVVARNAVASALVGNGTVRHEDFLTIQDKIVEVRRRALTMNQDLIDAGLSFTADISKQLIGFENINEFQDADQSINPNSDQNNDIVFTEAFVPSPITHQGFSVPFRQGSFDYKRSLGLSESVRQVSEKLEDTLCNGNANIVLTFNNTNHELLGYTNHPSRGTGTISDWTVGANQDKIVNELIDNIGAMWASQGGVGNDSVIVYVANDIWNFLQRDYNSGYPSKTIMDRMKDVAQVKDVKPAEKLTNGEVVLVELDARTIELAIATDIISVPHIKTNPMSPQVMTTYGCMVALIKVDSKGNTGIRHLTV